MTSSIIEIDVKRCGVGIKMGLQVSRLINSVPFRDYTVILQSSNEGRFTEVDLYSGLSTVALPSLPELFWEGIFTADPIPKGSFIRQQLLHRANDGVINLQPLLDADTSQDAFKAWHIVYNGYHNFDVIAQRTNIRAIGQIYPNNGVNTLVYDYYEVMTDIPVGGELLCYRGIGYWLIHAMISLSTRATLAGHIKFVDLAINQCHPIEQAFLQETLKMFRTHLNSKIPLRYEDPNYLTAYDTYYATIHQTESMYPILFHQFRQLPFVANSP